jgi:hypothetical protein
VLSRFIASSDDCWRLGLRPVGRPPGSRPKSVNTSAFLLTFGETSYQPTFWPASQTAATGRVHLTGNHTFEPSCAHNLRIVDKRS